MSNFANGVTPLVNGLPVDNSNPLPVTPEFDVGPLATSAKQDAILAALDAPVLSKLYLDAFGRVPVSNPISEGYVAGGNSSIRQANKSVTARYPITLDAAGAVRDLGTLTMLVTAYTGTSATRCVFNWREIR